VSEQGERLNIRPPTLRKWRRDFAANLRELGVAANATERAVRGQVKSGSETVFTVPRCAGSPFTWGIGSGERHTIQGQEKSRGDNRSRQPAKVWLRVGGVANLEIACLL
jgi:hypothetical protein